MPDWFPALLYTCFAYSRKQNVPILTVIKTKMTSYEMQCKCPSLEIFMKRKTHQIARSNIVLEMEVWTGQFLGASVDLKILTGFHKKSTFVFIAT